MPEPWDADALEFTGAFSGHTPAFSALFSALPARVPPALTPRDRWRQDIQPQ